jgi:hypothetical protein
VNPYRVEGPALISFSGGRTSAFMLKQILDAHDGQLPPDVHVTFANTGREREETLRFVHECGSRWGADIRWLEWRDRPKGAEGRDTAWQERFEEVGFNSASRKGEPLKALYRRKGYLPNAVTRFCTAEAKIDVMKWFMLAQGYGTWTNIIGLRADEMRRISKSAARNDTGKERWVNAWPMLHGRAYKSDVLRFWFADHYAGGKPNWDVLLAVPTKALPQGFDLGLADWEGNCIDCFLKGEAVLIHTERVMPGSLDFAIEQEKAIGATFITEHSYSDLKARIESQPLLIPVDLEFDAECGVSGTDHNIRCGRKAA